MKGYIALIRISLKLALREKAVLFFNYIFPLIFFFGFAQAFGGQASRMTQVVIMVLVIGMLGSGLFGAGMRAVAEREANILRRYKVAPINAAPILVASMVTGWLLYLPSALLILFLSHFIYGMALPARLFSLIALVTIGAITMRSIGLIIASVVNSIAESNILIQILYMPMLFLSGATFPLSGLPTWAQIVSQFLPASHLFAGMQGIVLNNESIFRNAAAVGALCLTTCVATFISVKLFRWEKEEKIGRGAKLWLLAVLLPFFVLGGYQAYSKENVTRSKLYDRNLRRGRTWLIRGPRIITEGKVIENGGVLIRNGKIDRVYEGTVPEAKALNADVIEAYGKTLVPGLIDVHVHLGATGGVAEEIKSYEPEKQMNHALEAYLYSGVTAIKSDGDFVDEALKARTRIQGAQILGAELFLVGPLFTAQGGHGTEYFNGAPQMLKNMAAEQFYRTPKNPGEAGSQVDALKAKGVDGIKAVLESGNASIHFNRLDTAIFNAIVKQTKADGLPVVVHTDDLRDVTDAVDAGVDGIEHGGMRERIPDELFARMAKAKISYDPTLSVIEALGDVAAGKTSLLDRSLVQQVVPNTVLQITREKITSPQKAKMREQIASFKLDPEIAKDNLRRAYRAGVPLVTGSDAGNILVFHGPTVQREIELWAEAGIPVRVALDAATAGGARLLRTENRMGFIKPGYEANLLLIDGNPLQDVTSTERVSYVWMKGELVNRSELFNQE